MKRSVISTIFVFTVVFVLSACASGQHKYDDNNPFDTSFEAPCQVYDDDDYFAATGIYRGSASQKGEVQKLALANAQDLCRMKMKHVYKGKVNDFSQSRGNNMGNDIEIKVSKEGEQIIDAVINETQAKCAKFSGVSSDGMVESYVAIKIPKMDMDKKMATVGMLRERLNEDGYDCEIARRENSINGWNIYLHQHKNGKCAKDAELEIDKLACERAKSEGTIISYKKYLKYHQEGLCAHSFNVKIKEKEEDYDSCQESRHYNKEVYDDRSPDYKKYNRAIDKWEKYLEYYPDGKCANEARTQIRELEEKEIERKANDFPADDKTIGRLFTGRFNFGYVTMFEGSTRSGVDLGLDFNFNLFQPKGIGGGNLYTGLSLDVAWYFPYYRIKINDKKEKIHLLEIPFMANLGYDFQIGGNFVRFIGAWFAAGGGYHFFNWQWKRNIIKGPGKYADRISFAWELGLDLIFSSGFMITLGAGGFISDGFRIIIKNDGTHLFMNIGTIF